MATKSKSKRTKSQSPRIKTARQSSRSTKKSTAKKKAARIANTSRKKAAKRGAKAEKYEEMSREDLYKKAKKAGIEGRSRMKKNELVRALRSH